MQHFRYPEERRMDAVEAKLNYWRKRELEVSKDKAATARGELEIRFVKRLIAENIERLEREMGRVEVMA